MLTDTILDTQGKPEERSAPFVQHKGSETSEEPSTSTEGEPVTASQEPHEN